MSATTARSAGKGRRRRFTSTRRPATASIRAASWPLGPASCRPTPTPATTPSTPPSRKPAPDHRGCVLVAWAARFLSPRQARQGADRRRDRAPHRRSLRHRARDQRRSHRTRGWRSGRSAPSRSSPGSKPTCASSCCRLSPKNDVAKAIRYMLTRWAAFTRFLDDGRICLSATTPPSAPCAASPSGAATGPSPAPTRGLHTAHLVIPLYLKEIFLAIVRRRASRPPSVGFAANGLARQLGMGDYPGRALARLARGKRSLGDQATHG